jgi:predicted TIM-barrel fold metal-dependent hydrolase
VNIKRNALFQSYIFPFLGIDPRQNGFDLVGEWVAKYIHHNYGFYGIKIYPAAGFFPFDSRLDPVWAWAQENNIPVMTHTTRSGSFYLGTFDSLLNSGALQTAHLNPNDPLEKRIIDRVSKVIADKSIHNDNGIWCNIFGYPDNYELVLRKYPNLKICLAHLGGATEVLRTRIGEGKKTECGGRIPKYPDSMKDNWYDMVVDLMTKYRNVYSDISYTLSCDKALGMIADRFRRPGMVDDYGTPLMNKLMYGTDFYLTQQEKSGDEPDLQGLFLNHFNQAEVRLLACDNPAAYLKSAIWP